MALITVLAQGLVGDVNLLLELGSIYGYETSIIPPVKVGSEIVSSTAIRKYIEAGDITKANEYLGRPFTINGDCDSRKSYRFKNRISDS